MLRVVDEVFLESNDLEARTLHSFGTDLVSIVIHRKEVLLVYDRHRVYFRCRSITRDHQSWLLDGRHYTLVKDYTFPFNVCSCLDYI